MKKLIKWTVIGLLSAALTLCVTVGGYFCLKGYEMYKNAVEKMSVAQIGENIRSQDDFTTYSELPEIYVDAVIAAEDKRFERHNGIDILAILRAAWVDVTTLSITQQLAKNELFTQEKRVERKIAEVFAAFALEGAYSKEEIFELYINSIYFGNGFYGIRSASEGYFGKEPSELSDAEAVMLAGLPNAPSVYTPSENPDLALRRSSVVLRRMVECGRLTQAEADRIRLEAETMFE